MGLQKTVFGKQKAKPNTFIGGVSATINTPALVATKLGISVTRIKAFSIIGSNIQFAVTGGSYALPNSCFNNNTSITYFDDKDGLVSSNEGFAFRNATNLVYIYLPNIVSLGYQFCYGCTSLVEIKFTKLITLGYEDFVNCNNLQVLNDSFVTVINLGNRSFDGCSKITSLNLPVAGEVPHHVQSIFRGMTLLQTLYAPKMKYPTTGLIWNSGISMFQDCTSLVTVTLTDMNIISSNWFYNCTSLVTLSLPSLVNAYLSQTFYRTLLLTTIETPLLTTIVGGGYYAFIDSKVNSLDFKNVSSLSDFGTSVFGGGTVVSQLTSIDIRSVTSLGSSSTSQNIFANIKIGCVITANVALATNNAGAADGDLQYAITSRGATVNYV